MLINISCSERPHQTRLEILTQSPGTPYIGLICSIYFFSKNTFTGSPFLDFSLEAETRNTPIDVRRKDFKNCDSLHQLFPTQTA